MVEVERRYIASSGATLGDLMEKAGKAVAEEVSKDLSAQRIIVVCGKGNNGGDGYVCARELFKQGRKVKVYVLADESELRSEAAGAFRALKEVPVEIIFFNPAGLEDFKVELDSADLVVDALFGLGFKGAAKGLAARIIGLINSVSANKVSVDVPSGVEASTGRIAGPAIRADKTITFTCLKPGLLLGPGRECAGELKIADLGIPFDIIREMSTTQLLTPEEIAAFLPRRQRDAHKKECGRVLVLAGSVGMTGAAYLTSQAALKSGAGLVTLGIPASLNKIMEVKLTEVMTLPLPETEAQSLDIEGLDKILEFSKGFDTVALGPGLSLKETTPDLVRELVAKMEKPLVLDADGLNALAGKADFLAKRTFPSIITPHPGEMGRLLGIDPDEVQSDRLKLTKKSAKAWGCIVVLKGAETVISNGKQTAVNPTGNQGMASAGTGDVLTGMIVGLWAQGLNAFDAACVGAYLHGFAGDEAADDLTEYSLTASDVLEYISEAFYKITGGYEKWMSKEIGDENGGQKG